MDLDIDTDDDCESFETFIEMYREATQRYVPDRRRFDYPLTHQHVHLNELGHLRSYDFKPQSWPKSLIHGSHMICDPIFKIYDYKSGSKDEILKAIQAHTMVTTLTFDGDSIALSSNRVNELFSVISNINTLTKLEFTSSPLLLDSINVLASCIRENTTLRNLTLHKSAFHKEGVESILEMLTVNTTLTSLDLRDNTIDFDDGFIITKPLSVNTTLSSLVLSGNMCDHDRIWDNFKLLFEVNFSITHLAMPSKTMTPGEIFKQFYDKGLDSIFWYETSRNESNQVRRKQTLFNLLFSTFRYYVYNNKYIK
jgi:hypothetical protein